MKDCSAQIESIKRQFDEFVQHSEKKRIYNKYLLTEDISIYLRKHISLASDAGYLLCIPTISFEEEIIGIGVFKEIILYIENHAGHYSAIEFENLYNEKLESDLRRNGYIDSPFRSSQFDIVLYKPLI